MWKIQIMLYSRDTTIRIHIHAEAKSTKMMNKHTSLEKYTSHTLFETVAKRLQNGCVWEVSWRLNRLQHIDPKFLYLYQHFFLILLAAQPGVLPRTATRTPTNWLQLTRTVCGTGLYNCLTSTCFLWASHLHRIQPVHMSRLYLRPDAPVSRLTAESKVNMLQ